MDVVSFTRMDEGTEEDYALVGRLYREHVQETLLDNVLNLLRQMQGPKLGYKIDRYQHSLQTATRAERDGADEETIVCALLHDIGDVVAPRNHSQFAAAVLRPYVSDKNHWILKHHGLFQGYYYYDKIGKDKNAREALRGHEFFDACEAFCEKWDQTSFDPDYDTYDLDHFVPMVRRLLERAPQDFD
ncbi:MAG TPA: HD domain-containing protein [Kiloniellaceae bacterium]|nr:HD domain-containing protein [Kiloniellaceae bacterium]